MTGFTFQTKFYALTESVNWFIPFFCVPMAALLHVQGISYEFWADLIISEWVGELDRMSGIYINTLG